MAPNTLPDDTDHPPQAVADLIWAVSSPSLVSGPDVAEPTSVQAAEIDHEALSSFLAERTTRRVGYYFEHLLHFWLLHVRGVEVLHHGLQIRDGKRTLGELDFVYRDEAGVVVHCEAAVKFFLHHERQGRSSYPGPNAADDFERKTERLFGHQLPLSREHMPAVDRREAFVKGRIHYRDEVGLPKASPDRLADTHQRGRWLSARQLPELARNGGRAAGAAAIATKPHWLAPPADFESIDAVIEQLTEHFQGPGHPVLVHVYNEAAVATDAVFVVSETWPGESQDVSTN